MKILLKLVLLAVVFSITSCSKELFNSEYKYEVSGTGGSYDVTLENTDNNTQQHSSVGNGWFYEWEQSGTRWLYLSAQNNNSSGSVTVKIYRKGKVVAENTSYGGYTIATVSGDY